MFGLRIHYVPGWAKSIYPEPLWNKPRDQKIIYLTFDDGPVPGPTDFVIDTLAEYNAKATFFCVGDNIRKHPEQFEKILQAGHRPGNHTYNHKRGWTTDTELYIENAAQCEKIIEQHAGPQTRMLFRPPYGMIKKNQIAALKDRYQIIMWDVLSVDYDAAYNEEYCLRKTIRYTRPGSIVVFHDSYKAEKNLKFALPRYLRHFTDRGFEFRTL